MSHREIFIPPGAVVTDNLESVSLLGRSDIDESLFPLSQIQAAAYQARKKDKESTSTCGVTRSGGGNPDPGSSSGGSSPGGQSTHQPVMV